MQKYILFPENSLHGQKCISAAFSWQSQPRQLQLFPGQRPEDGGVPCPLLLPVPGGTVPQRPGGGRVSTHPLAVSFHYLPEEYCVGGCRHDFHVPF